MGLNLKIGFLLGFGKTFTRTPLATMLKVNRGRLLCTVSNIQRHSAVRKKVTSKIGQTDLSNIKWKRLTTALLFQTLQTYKPGTLYGFKNKWIRYNLRILIMYVIV